MTSEALAREITSFLDAHTCAHSPGCLVCMLEERIVGALDAYAAEQARAAWEAAAKKARSFNMKPPVTSAERVVLQELAREFEVYALKLCAHAATQGEPHGTD